MKKTWVLLAALIGSFLVLGVAPAQAYPDTTPTIRISLSDKVLVGGNSFTAKATADTTCVWSMTYLKQRATGSGRSISHRFSTPVVKKRTKTTLTVRCTYDPTGAGRPVASGQTSTVTRTATVTLLPRQAHSGQDHSGGKGHGHHSGDPGNPNTGGQSAAAPAQHGGGLLPDTGGFAWWWLLVAAVLVGGGATAVTRGRSRRTER